MSLIKLMKHDVNKKPNRIPMQSNGLPSTWETLLMEHLMSLFDG